jgi:hypothetical protein
MAAGGQKYLSVVNDFARLGEKKRACVGPGRSRVRFPARGQKPAGVKRWRAPPRPLGRFCPGRGWQLGVPARAPGIVLNALEYDGRTCPTILIAFSIVLAEFGGMLHGSSIVLIAFGTMLSASSIVLIAFGTTLSASSIVPIAFGTTLSASSIVLFAFGTTLSASSIVLIAFSTVPSGFSIVLASFSNGFHAFA